ncbi:MAG: CDP-alcohol phosphatidyltransferase family protein [Clostridiales bacterium]|nr:CDP-alcohol phosphatidyltransferase family protein [Clostridiales bacterium]
MIEKETSKNQIFTIPNLISLFRIILIPFIVLAYFAFDNNYLAIGLIVLSGVSDIADGIIARKYNMISDFGKILDPIADKLTQGTIIICLASQYTLLRLLIIIFILKEITMGIMGVLTVKRFGQVNGAKWYGKVNTVLLYVIMGLLVLFPRINGTLANVMIAACFISLVLSLFMYIRFYKGIWKEYKKENEQQEGNSVG